MRYKILLLNFFTIFVFEYSYSQTKNGGIIVYENQGEGLLAAPNDLALPYSYKESIVKCEEYVLNGFDNWRLPTKSELNLLYENRNKIGGFRNEFGSPYWSSTSDGRSNYAWYIDFYDGEKGFAPWDYGTSQVRCVRSFNSQEKGPSITNINSQTKKLTFDSISITFINSLKIFYPSESDYTQLQGIYQNPTPLGDGDDIKYLFYIITKNGVVLKRHGTDFINAFKTVTSGGKDYKCSIESNYKAGQLWEYSCSISGDKIIFKDKYGKIDNFHLDRNTHSLIWDNGFNSRGEPEGFLGGSLKFIAPL